MADHPETRFQELRETFPDALQADSPTQFSQVRATVTRLTQIPEQELKRFFVGTGETVQLADGDVAVSREWNRENIQECVGSRTMGGLYGRCGADGIGVKARCPAGSHSTEPRLLAVSFYQMRR